MSPHPGLLELCRPPLTYLAHFLRDPPSRFTHSKSLAKAFLLRPPLLLCPVGITLWPVRQNQMPGKGWGGGARSALRVYTFTSVSKGPSLGDSLACWVLFSPLTKSLSNSLHTIVEQLENAFLFLVVPPLRLCPLHASIAGTHSCARMWMCNMGICPLCPGRSNQSARLWSARCQPYPLPQTGCSRFPSP